MAGPRIVVQNRSTMTERSMRRPSHKWRIKFLPWEIQPFLIAPVLPGDSIKAASWQARVLTQPLADPLCGWWSETYLFYVPISLMDAADTLKDMIIGGGAAPVDPNNGWTYHQGGGIDWLKRSMAPIVRHYFRDEGEAWDISASAGQPPVAAIQGRDWSDTLIAEADLPEDPTDADDWVEKWNVRRQVPDMIEQAPNYEEYLRLHGVNAPPPLREIEQEYRVPELLRYTREFAYPSNTVEPTTGVPSSACSWVHAEKMDKGRFFGEPGFIVGLAVARPKVYMGNQRAPVANFMRDASSWFPSSYSRDQHMNMVESAGGTAGPISFSTEPYWWNMADLLRYGDQFLHEAPAAMQLYRPVVDTALRKYPTLTMQQQVFKDHTAGFGIESDGVIKLQIASRALDRTGSTPG